MSCLDEIDSDEVEAELDRLESAIADVESELDDSTTDTDENDEDENDEDGNDEDESDE